MLNLSSKNIILGISGGIAAYKSVELMRLLQKQGADVKVILTESAKEFVAPLTFQVLSGNPVYSKMFGDEYETKVRHIEWAEKADCVIIAPATANIIGKIANGISDDVLSTFMMAIDCPVVICPAMNSKMYENRIVQRNLDILEKEGFIIVEPASGELACGTQGKGRFPDHDFIVDQLISSLTKKDLEGKNVLVTAGPTRESFDPVRYITNHSSGKMGYSLAKMARLRGANVTLISGPTNLSTPYGVNKIPVTTAQEMADQVFSLMDENDIIIKVAAVADYSPVHVEDQKIKKKSDELTLNLKKNTDILKEVGKRKKDQILIGFAAETNEMEEYASGKLVEKNLDMIVGNIVGVPSSGFGSDTNKVTMFFRSGDSIELPSMEKENVANAIIDRIIKRFLR
jgi:phosphopantothenoylcysteine decarboxylase/phosphopantothenate--cysteine ligase